MSFRELNQGEEVQVGDVLIQDTALGQRKWAVTRKSKKFAFVKINDVAELKFQVLYSRVGYQPLPRMTWTTTTYKIFRKS